MHAWSCMWACAKISHLMHGLCLGGLEVRAHALSISSWHKPGTCVEHSCCIASGVFAGSVRPASNVKCSKGCAALMSGCCVHKRRTHRWVLGLGSSTYVRSVPDFPQQRFLQADMHCGLPCMVQGRHHMHLRPSRSRKLCNHSIGTSTTCRAHADVKAPHTIQAVLACDRGCQHVCDRTVAMQSILASHLWHDRRWRLGNGDH